MADPARRSVRRLTRAFALSRRESELLGLLAKGGDSRTVARHMFVSEHTVQDRLKSVFAKTETKPLLDIGPCACLCRGGMRRRAEGPTMDE